MAFKYSCFISYRHTEFELGRTRTKRITDALKGQLELSAPLPVYLDQDRLKGGQFYREELALAVCHSVCMVVLYWPTYFSLQHTFCSREFKLMEKLEQERLALLPVPKRVNSLIIVIALADSDTLPKEIRDSRHCYDFEPYVLAHNMNSHPEFVAQMRQIRRYVRERCLDLDAPQPPDPCADCPQCRLPDHETVLPWIQQQLHPGIPYPTREGGR
jgi:hypothetical protein